MLGQGRQIGIPPGVPHGRRLIPQEFDPHLRMGIEAVQKVRNDPKRPVLGRIPLGRRSLKDLPNPEGGVGQAPGTAPQAPTPARVILLTHDLRQAGKAAVHATAWKFDPIPHSQVISQGDEGLPGSG
jgi:hypothetical protein